MGFNNTAKNAMLTELGTLVTHIAIHEADPGTTGTSEVTGGSPAYARKAVTWGSPSAGVMSPTGSLVFDMPAGSDAAFFGLWSASSAGTFYGGGALSATESFTGQGTYTLTDADLTLS